MPIRRWRGRDPVTTVIALLRGINVGGQKMIKMADLKSIFESMGFLHVRTYIQTGNVIFETDEDCTDLLRENTEHRLADALGYEVPVILRTLTELEDIIRNNPFDGSEITDPKQLYVSFLSAEPAGESVNELARYTGGGDDEIRVIHREVYLLCRQPYHKTAYSNHFLERKLKVQATARNWNTVNKVISIGRS